MARIILGIDPGTNVMGYGLIECEGSVARLIDMGTLNLNKVSDPMEKLQSIFATTLALIEKHGPAEAAIEDPFYGKNVQSMLKLGRAQGMAIAAAIHAKVPVYQYAARKIKQSVTGKGSASKEQVAGMLKHILKFQDTPKLLDATDGLAVALCHFYQNRVDAGGKKFNSWQNFIAKNPGRISS